MVGGFGDQRMKRSGPFTLHMTDLNKGLHLGHTMNGSQRSTALRRTGEGDVETSCIVPDHSVHGAYLDTLAERLRPSTLSNSLSFPDDTTLPDVITNNTWQVSTLDLE